LPVDGWPKMSICFDGIERDEDTESRIEDHRSCGGASGVDDRESSIIFEVERDQEPSPACTNKFKLSKSR
jgi:hypothetical protein